MSEVIKAENNPKKNNKVALIFTILTVIIIAQSVKIFMDARQRMEIEQRNESDQKELASTLQRLNEVNFELTEKIAEIERLGGNIDDLAQAKLDVEEELKRIRQRNRSTISKLTAKVEGYEELLLSKDDEIEELRKLADELYSENNTLKTERNQLNRTITELNQSKNELESKVTVASRLKAENIKIIAVSSRGRERESPFRAQQINQLKVSFNIGENNVAPIEGKDVLLKVLDPQTNAIYDFERGSGTFTYGGKEEFYTAGKEILFDNSKQQLTFIYDKGSEYEPGNYIIEIYTDDYKMGVAKFEVK